MPLTPIDGFRGDRSQTPRGESRESSVTQRLWSRVKGLLDTVPMGGPLFGQPDDDPREQATESEKDTVTELPAQDQSSTVPAVKTPEYEQVEPVCIETDTELTISLPENPEATITSDVWERVER